VDTFAITIGLLQFNVKEFHYLESPWGQPQNSMRAACGSRATGW